MNLKKTSVWCFSTYLAEGLPFAIIRILSSVFFTDIGVKERYLGYLNFLGIPWNLKFLWAPFLDIFGKKRTWMIAVQAVISLLVMGISFFCLYRRSSGRCRLGPGHYFADFHRLGLPFSNQRHRH